jgi:hypothetical protein
MSKYDKIVSDAEARIKAERSQQQQHLHESIESAKKNREIGEKLLRDVILPELSELQQAFQKNGRKVSLELNEPHIEIHKRTVLVSARLFVSHPRVVPGLELEFLIAHNDPKMAVHMVTGSKPEIIDYELEFSGISSSSIQSLLEEFIANVYK